MRTAQRLTSFFASLLFVFSTPVYAQTETGQPSDDGYIDDDRIPNMMEEINPFDPNIEETLQLYDRIYEEETGKSAHLDLDMTIDEILGLAGCRRETCSVWAQVVKSSQHMYLYINGSLSGSWPVSTGISGYSTPNFDKHPNGRVYDRYSSDKFPGGDYNGLGNMPYAVFISGGFALHGTPRGNWPKLGTRASHGCIRMHPDNAYTFNRLVRGYGVRNVWITVQ
jgi:hypothetical protein